MSGYVGNIKEKALKNNNFREVVFTGKHCQLVVMSLKPGEEIGSEIHENADQILRVVMGRAKLILDGEESYPVNNTIIIVPAGTEHNVVNVSSKNDLKLYTIYSPSQHEDVVIHK
jgi:mannose-6-phosphate isomerase-like protein (cupin superfamily)